MIQPHRLALLVPLIAFAVPASPGRVSEQESGSQGEHQTDSRARVPTGIDLDAAREKVKEHYKPKLARAEADPASRRELARTLLADAEDLDDSAVHRYAVLLQAYDLAIAGRDCQVGLDVVEKMVAWFRPVDGDALRRGLVLGISEGLQDEAKPPMVVRLGLDLIDECMVREDARNARQILDAIARRARKNKVSEEIARLEGTDEALKQLEAYLAAVVTLESNKADEAANDVVGRRLMFVKGELELGLKHLQQGPEGPLKRCAQLDLANPTEFAARMAVGEAWHDWSKTEREGPQSVAHRRAQHWFALAHEMATGLDRKAAEDRLKEIESASTKLSRNSPPKSPNRAPDPVEQAISLARDWLVAHQSRDGSWDCDGFSSSCGKLGQSTCDGPGSSVHDVGVTGLALLALSSSDAEKHTAAVQKGLKWLVSKQSPEGLLQPHVQDDSIYDHAIGSLALAKVGIQVDSKAYTSPAQKAINLILQARNHHSAWRYEPQNGDNDTSVTGWMISALASARDAGLEGDFDGAFKGALSFIDEVTDPSNGSVGYSAFGMLSSRTPANEHFPPEKGEAMTAVGLLCRILLGQKPKEFPVMDKHAQRIRSKPPVWDPDGFGSDFYYWYHATHALSEMGAPYWPPWKKAMKAAMVESQSKQDDEKGSWDPSVCAWGYSGGRIYATAIMCLSLEASLGR